MPRLPIIVVAPNVSQQMGGEAMKALQIFNALRAVRPDTRLITHERNRSEVLDRLRLPNVSLVPDTFVARFLWQSVVLRGLLDLWFSWRAIRLAEALAARERVIVFQAEPNSPVVPRTLSKRHVNVFGPINGNIYYPEMFRHAEKSSARLRRLLHMPLQQLNKFSGRGLSRADLILAAGGERTKLSLYAAGCSPQNVVDTIDCGIQDSLVARPRVTHQGFNPRFVHFGRLVFHKGTVLVIESLAKTRHAIRLDIIGNGPELERCKARARLLGLEGRVTFISPFESQDDLIEQLVHYRGVVLPSIEDANGMVVQESMAIGLPAVCLDWGGPKLLIEHGKTGFLVPPVSMDQITTDIARHLDALAEDGALAERFSESGRRRAEDWRWTKTVEEWLALFDRAAATPARV